MNRNIVIIIRKLEIVKKIDNLPSGPFFVIINYYIGEVETLVQI